MVNGGGYDIWIRDPVDGCMRFLPGSNAEAELRTHAPVNIGDSRLGEDSSHALCTTLRPEDEDKVRQVEIKRGARQRTEHERGVAAGIRAGRVLRRPLVDNAFAYSLDST